MKLLVLLTACILLAGPLHAHARQPVAAHASFDCPAKNVVSPDFDQKLVYVVLDKLNQAFDDALGTDAKRLHEEKVRAKVALSTVDPAKMAELGDVAACAALIDVQSSCSQYFDPDLGNPLGVFMGMKKSAPLRRQFEAAIANVANREQRHAAQTCIRLVGHR